MIKLMIDCYKILNIDKNSSIEEINHAYKTHIKRYCGLPFLTNKMIDEVKNLKKAIYILGNPDRKYKYDNRNKTKHVRFQLNDYNSDFQENTKINDRIFGDIFNN